MNELKSIVDLKAADYNPRKIGEESLAGLKTSLQSFGDISGITWNARTGNLVTGHQRMRSLRELHGDALRLETDAEGSWVIAPDGNRWLVRVVDWDALTEKAANVAANSPKIAGEFEFESLGAILGELEAAEFPAFDELRFDDLLTDLEATPSATAKTAPDDFKEYGEDIETQFRCPKCAYEWSGKPK